MTPFEELIRQLSFHMDVTLHPDAHQSCLISFPQDDLSIQIDLDANADQILVGTQLGRVTPGTYREKLFIQALRVNGLSQTPRGILAFSEKNDTLVLFQFLRLEKLNGEKLHAFLHIFREHANLWKKAVSIGDIPTIQDQTETKGGSGMFGLRQ
jgi:hypothetical protein